MSTLTCTSCLRGKHLCGGCACSICTTTSRPTTAKRTTTRKRRQVSTPRPARAQRDPLAWARAPQIRFTGLPRTAEEVEGTEALLAKLLAEKES